MLPMITVSPRKSLTVPTSDDVVRSLGLKKGIKLVALGPERAVIGPLHWEGMH